MSFQVSLLRRNSFSWLALHLALLVWSQAHNSSSSLSLWCWMYYGHGKISKIINTHSCLLCLVCRYSSPWQEHRAEDLPLVPFSDALWHHCPSNLKMPIKCRLMLWISLVGSTPGEFSLLSLCRFLCRCVHLLSTLYPVKMPMVLLPTWNFLHFIYKLSGVGSLVLLREFSGTLRPGAPAQSLFIITAGNY